MRYYIADLHFFHGALNDRMDCRGFKSAEEMNEYMIEQWNQVVRRKDEVVILGDFSVGGAEETNGILERLKGKLYLIEGNHDRYLKKKEFHRERFQWIKPYGEMRDEGRKVILSHYPVMCYHGQYQVDEEGRPKVYMLYGHVHDSFDQRLMERFQRETRECTREVYPLGERQIPCQMINCFSMYADYQPRTLDQWIESSKAREEN